MFSKKFRVKSNSSLKGSERKKLRADVNKHFPQLKESDLLELIPNKDAATAVKLVTHSEDIVTVYMVQNTPVFFDFDKTLFPTVYTLWRYKDLLYAFTTWPSIYSRLLGGADLMLPGVIVDDPYTINSFGKLKRGDLVAVNTTFNCAPIAVGTAALSSEDMYMSAKRGKAVLIKHIYGDELWQFGPKLSIPELGPPIVGSPDVSMEQLEEPSIVTKENDCDSTSEEKSESTIPTNSDNLNIDTGEILSCVEDLNGLSLSEPKECDPTQAMDELVLYCFIKALKIFPRSTELPILVSKFYKLYMLSACPQSKSLDMKKTSFKKLSTFLSHVQSLEIIKLEDVSKGVQKITFINMSHPKLREFVDTETNEPENASCVELQQNKYSCPLIQEVYVVTAAVLPLMAQFGLGYRKGSTLDGAVARKHISNYIRSNKLQDQSDPSLVNLDFILAKVLKKRSPSSLSWEKVMSEIFNLMSRSYQVTAAGRERIVGKGHVTSITIRTSMRSGNKKVTLVDIPDIFGINLSGFSKDCQHGVAASTSITEKVYKKSHEILIQGNHTGFVENLLTKKYEIPRKFVKLID